MDQSEPLQGLAQGLGAVRGESPEQHNPLQGIPDHIHIHHDSFQVPKLACQISLDITLNFQMTFLYLELTTIYIQLMMLLSRVEDRKAVLGLFNAAYEISQNQ